MLRTAVIKKGSSNIPYGGHVPADLRRVLSWLLFEARLLGIVGVPQGGPPPPYRFIDSKKPKTPFGRSDKDHNTGASRTLLLVAWQSIGTISPTSLCRWRRLELSMSGSLGENPDGGAIIWAVKPGPE